MPPLQPSASYHSPTRTPFQVRIIPVVGKLSRREIHRRTGACTGTRSGECWPVSAPSSTNSRPILARKHDTRCGAGAAHAQDRLRLARAQPQSGTGLVWSLPAGWRAVGPRLTSLANPAQRPAAATFDVQQAAPDRDRTPGEAGRADAGGRRARAAARKPGGGSEPALGREASRATAALPARSRRDPRVLRPRAEPARRR